MAVNYGLAPEFPDGSNPVKADIRTAIQDTLVTSVSTISDITGNDHSGTSLIYVGGNASDRLWTGQIYRITGNAGTASTTDYPNLLVYDAAGNEFEEINHYNINAVLPEWFGALGDGSDDHQALDDAINAAVNKGFLKVIISQDYFIGSDLEIQDSVVVEAGAYRKGSINPLTSEKIICRQRAKLRYVDTECVVDIGDTIGTSAAEVAFEHCSFFGVTGINHRHGWNITFYRCKFFENDIWYNHANNGFINSTLFQECRFQKALTTEGIRLSGTVNNMNFIGNVFDGGTATVNANVLTGTANIQSLNWISNYHEAFNGDMLDCSGFSMRSMNLIGNEFVNCDAYACKGISDAFISGNTFEDINNFPFDTAERCVFGGGNIHRRSGATVTDMVESDGNWAGGLGQSQNRKSWRVPLSDANFDIDIRDRSRGISRMVTPSDTEHFVFQRPIDAGGNEEVFTSPITALVSFGAGSYSVVYPGASIINPSTGDIQVQFPTDTFGAATDSEIMVVPTFRMSTNNTGLREKFIIHDRGGGVAKEDIRLIIVDESGTQVDLEQSEQIVVQIWISRFG